ncbi:glycosyltransferase [Aliarcobacter skirrowii]|uniref:glycosyltransferase family 2 protein n=1 Tax=Aliarcobacter skirrowii TaxID=28200 RepID=UPI0029A08EC7|nr:glycosyltransferase [Aliarcobacter skirrowii]MDX4012122.1 glycosyltransferase [Aliarcobacter skirrowii]MDX4065627.1 glycosyltransferase [Aliarcobacter skirrowii]
MNKPLVSICCAAYNHEEYIEETLKGFLMQECDFEYEILIHDDASTDKTAKIIRKYEKMYSNKIFPIYQTQNQYSQGKKYSDLNYERVKGKYVAICEGDDCWIDKNKLAKQIKLMEANPTFGLCFHPAVQLNLTNNTKKNIGEYLDKDGVVSIEDIIIKPYGMIPYASCVLTKEVLDEVLEFKSTRPYLTLGDIYVQIFGALKANGVLYINEVMSLYRYLTPQSWSVQWVNSSDKQFKHVIAMAKSFQDLNKMTEYKYCNAFELSIIKKLFVLPNSNDLNKIPNVFKIYVDKLIKILNELNSSDEEFILYGAGASSELIIEHLNNKIKFILDSDPLKNGLTLNQKTIFNLDKLSQIKNEKILISIIMRSDDAQKVLQQQYNISSAQIIKIDNLLLDGSLDRLIFEESK